MHTLIYGLQYNTYCLKLIQRQKWINFDAHEKLKIIKY